MKRTVQFSGLVLAGDSIRRFHRIFTVITARDIRDTMQARPFRPFRICLSDGTHCEITNHDMAFVDKNLVEIGLNRDPEGFAESFARCSILHVTKLENLAESASKS